MRCVAQAGERAVRRSGSCPTTGRRYPMIVRKRRRLAGAVAAHEADELAGADARARCRAGCGCPGCRRRAGRARASGRRLRCERVRGRLPTIAAIDLGVGEEFARARGRRAPCRACSATMRLEYSATRSMSCSTRMIAFTPARLRAASITLLMRPCLSPLETPLVGSSSRITSGTSANALAMSSSFFSPCESSRASASSLPSRPKIAATSRTRAFDAPSSRSTEAKKRSALPRLRDHRHRDRLARPSARGRCAPAGTRAPCRAARAAPGRCRRCPRP